MDVAAKTDCVVYAITIDTLKIIVGENFREVIFFNFITLAFEKSANFNNIETNLIEKSFEYFQNLKFDKNETVLASGYNALNKLVIVAEGNLKRVRIYY